jgi:hypothetical protein
MARRRAAVKRCVFCRKRIWPWQRQGWIVDRATWHPWCELEWRAARDRPLTLGDIQAVLDEAQQ